MTTWQKYLGMGVAGLAVLALMAQLIRPDETNPAPDPSKEFTAEMTVPTEVADMLFASCGDCHSNRTTWPLYAQITPINWWIASHVTEGRHELNLSDWSYNDDKTRRKLKAIEDELTEDGMPPAYYRPFHGSVALTEAERTTIVAWAKAELDSRGGPLPERDEE